MKTTVETRTPIRLQGILKNRTLRRREVGKITHPKRLVRQQRWQMGQRGFFDEENRLESRSKLGDPLERLDALVPWEEFRDLLSRVHE